MTEEKYEGLLPRFLKYVKTETRSNPDSVPHISCSAAEDEFLSGIFLCKRNSCRCGRPVGHLPDFDERGVLKVLGLIDKPTGGKVYFYRKSIADLWSDELADIRRQKIGFIFQDFYLLNSLTVRENIMLPMVLDKREGRRCTEKGEELAEKFGLIHLLEKYPYELSGGEKQRTAISRALINNPDLILADEPTGNLDSRSSQNVIDTLCQINREMGKTIIMVTHDPRMASYCSRLILLKDGVVLEDIERKEEQKRFYQKILEKM